MNGSALLPLCLLLLFALAPRLNAQDAPPPEAGLTYGARVIGAIDETSPRVVYAFDALRGDVITIDLAVTDGNLDPVLALLATDGTIVALRDDSGSLDGVHIESLRIPTSARYYLIVGRFGYGLGTTSGEYTLSLDRLGASSVSGGALRYGDSVVNTITDTNPQIYFSFRAQRGDILNIRMQRMSGDLDPALMVVDSSGVILAENDDAPGSLDASINGLIIERDGTYVIIASRFGQAAGRSGGAFVLSLATSAQRGLGLTVQAAIPLDYGETVQGELTNDSAVQFYRFEGRAGDIVRITMRRVGGTLDSLLALADPGLTELTSDDDSGGGQDARIEAFVLPADGAYFIIATRYQRQTGQTSGRYELTLEQATP